MVMPVGVENRDEVPIEEKDSEGLRDIQIECPAGSWIFCSENKDLVGISV